MATPEVKFRESAEWQAPCPGPRHHRDHLSLRNLPPREYDPALFRVAARCDGIRVLPYVGCIDREDAETTTHYCHAPPSALAASQCDVHFNPHVLT